MAIGTGLALLGGSLISAFSSNHSANKAAKASKSAEAQALAENARQFDLVRSDTAPTRQLGANAVSALSRLYGYGPTAQPGTGAPVGTGTTPSGYTGDPNNLAGRIAYRVFNRDGVGRGPTTFDNGTGQPVDSPVASGSPDMSVFFNSPDYAFNFAEGQKGLNNSLVASHGALSGAGAKAGIRYASGMASREYGAFVDRLMQQAGLGNTGIGASAAAGANSASNVSNVVTNSANARGNIYMNNAANINNSVQGGISNYLLTRYLGNGGGGSGGMSGYPMSGGSASQYPYILS